MLQEYTKQTLINDKVKIEEVFVGQEISHINYYLDNDENQIQIRQKYINNSRCAKFTTFTNNKK